MWCSVSLTTDQPHNKGTDKSSKAGQSAEQSSMSHTATPAANANQTESGASMPLKIPTTHSMKLWKTQSDADGVSLEWVKQRTQYYK